MIASQGVQTPKMTVWIVQVVFIGQNISPWHTCLFRRSGSEQHAPFLRECELALARREALSEVRVEHYDADRVAVLQSALPISLPWLRVGEYICMRSESRMIASQEVQPQKSLPALGVLYRATRSYSGHLKTQKKAQFKLKSQKPVTPQCIETIPQCMVTNFLR